MTTRYRIVVIPVTGPVVEVPGVWTAATATEHARTAGYPTGTVLLVERCQGGEWSQYRRYEVREDGRAVAT